MTKMTRMFRLLLIIFSLVIYGCEYSPNKNQVDNQNWSKVRESDDFLDFISFMRENPESNHFENALNLYFEKRELYWEENMPPHSDCFNNCGQFIIDSLGEISFENSMIKNDSLRGYLLKFLINEKNKVNWPNKSTITDSKGINREITKGAFELIFDKNQTKNLKTIVSTISYSFEDYKEYLSSEWYNKKFGKLNHDEKFLLDSLLEYRLSFWRFEDIPEPPPPPPPIEKNNEE